MKVIYNKAKNCTCFNDLMVSIGLAEACHACVKARQLQVVKS